MKVSVITVCYNSAKTIQGAIESVLSQDYPNMEYIIVDGGSSDSTLDIIKDYRTEIDILISEADSGIYDAMNKGVKRATGEVVGILNSDDVYATNFEVSNIVKAFKEDIDSALVFGNVLFKNFENGKPIRYYSAKSFRPYKLRFGWMPPHPATFVKKDIYLRYGAYSLDYSISSDYERFINWLLVHREPYTYVNRTIVHMRMGGASTAGVTSILKLNGEIIRGLKSNGIRSNWIFLLVKVPFKLLEYVFPGKR